MGSWKERKFKILKKPVYAINMHNLEKVLADHVKRGWIPVGEPKEYGYGFMVVVEYPPNKRSTAVQ